MLLENKDVFVRGIDNSPHYRHCLIEAIDPPYIMVIINVANRPRKIKVNPDQISISGLPRIPLNCEDILKLDKMM